MGHRGLVGLVSGDLFPLRKFSINNHVLGPISGLRCPLI